MQTHPVAPVKIIRVLGRMNIGGPAVHVVHLTQALNNEKFHSILVTGTVGESEGDMRYLARHHGVTPVIIPELGRKISPVDDLVALWKLYRFFAKERPDIVHTHTAKAGTLGRVAALLARVRIKVHTFHGHVFYGYFGFIKTKLFLLIERLLARFTTRIVVISQRQLADLADRYRIAARGKFTIVPLGLDLDPLLQLPDGGADRRPGGEACEIIVGFVGRLVPIKDPLLALRVFERLGRNRTDNRRYRLIVVGGGELQATLEEWARQAGLSDQVMFAGWQEDLAAIYARIDLVLLTSRNEGTPVALIEAMAAARPVVAARVGGVEDLMSGVEEIVHGPNGRPVFSLFNNGALAAPGDVEGFAAATEYLLAHPGRMVNMGGEGRRFVRERFSRQRLVTDTEELYRDCLGEKAATPMKADQAFSLAAHHRRER